MAPPTDPNLLTDTRERLDEFDVLRAEEIDTVMPALMAISLNPRAHGEVYSALAPARERFLQLPEEDRLAFRDALMKFVRVYSFLSQVVDIGSVDLERDYVYCRALANYLRDATTSARLDLGAEVQLTHLRNEVTFEGSLPLESDTAAEVPVRLWWVAQSTSGVASGRDKTRG